MGSLTNFQQIPVVDVAGLYGPPGEQAVVAQALRRVAGEVGFLYVTASGVPEEYFDALLAWHRSFFALPLEEKMKVYIGNSSNHRGYVPTGEEGDYGNPDDEHKKKKPDLKEAFDLSLDLPADDADYLAGNPMLGPNQWPALPAWRDRQPLLRRDARLRQGAAARLRTGAGRAGRALRRHGDEGPQPAATDALPVSIRTPPTSSESAPTPTSRSSRC